MAKKGKAGRSKRKKERFGSPLSLFVRGKISASKYWELTGQSLRMPKN